MKKQLEILKTVEAVNYEEEIKVLELVEKINDREELLEEIAKAGETVTDITRVVYNNELELVEGQEISGLGTHWSDMNDKNFGNNGGYYNDEFTGQATIFYVTNAKGYKVKYITEAFAEENGIEYEEELELIDLYDNFYRSLGTDETLFGEAEILISQDTKFRVVSVDLANDETNFAEVHLEII